MREIKRDFSGYPSFKYTCWYIPSRQRFTKSGMPTRKRGLAWVSSTRRMKWKLLGNNNGKNYGISQYFKEEMNSNNRARTRNYESNFRNISVSCALEFCDDHDLVLRKDDRRNWY